jgi:hypothetical protein
MSVILQGLKTFFSGGKIVEQIGNIIDDNRLSKEEAGNQQIDLEKIKVEVTRAVNEHLMKGMELQLEADRLIVEDRNSAREMQIVALKQNDPLAKRFVYFLSTLIILAAIFFGVALMFVEVPEANRDLVNQFVAVFLFAGAVTVLNFWFGSSKGSQAKDERSQVNKP